MLCICRWAASLDQKRASAQARKHGSSLSHLFAPAAGADRRLDSTAFAIDDYGWASVLREDQDEGHLWLE